MKRISFLILALVVLSLACSMSAMPPIAGTPRTLTNAGDVGDVGIATPWVTCVKVISKGALHLRARAGDGEMVIAYLDEGMIVFLLDQSDSEWWGVSNGRKSGYARSIYLEEVSCDGRR